LKFLLARKGNQYTAANIIYYTGLSPSSVHANLAKLRAKGEVSWEWGEHLSQKARPARYYFHKEETKWKLQKD